jgi:hypothetical protein
MLIAVYRPVSPGSLREDKDFGGFSSIKVEPTIVRSGLDRNNYLESIKQALEVLSLDS